MSGSIKISLGGKVNKKPIITDFVQFGEISDNSFSIKYTAIDKDNIPLKHYLYVNGTKRDISNDVGADNINREFTYTLNGLTFRTEYNLQLEVFDGSITVQSPIIKVTTNEKRYIYGVRVDESNSNPETSVTYIEDAIGIEEATSTSLGGWNNVSPFNKIKLVGFKNGQEVGDINPDNKTAYLNGQTVPADVDIMSKIPKIYWDVKTLTNGYEIRIGEHKFNSTCDCYAHKVGGVEKDYIYVGAYLGYVENGKLRSKSRVQPTTNTSLSNFRTYAQANGQGYQQMNWFTLKILQILYLIAYKNLNSQQALGMGLCNGSLSYTGGTNMKGFLYGSNNNTLQMCFLGIEDLWGNLIQWVDGAYYGNNSILITNNNKNFNNSGSQYINIGSVVAFDYGYMDKILKTNTGIFFPLSNQGSDTTYYCDYSKVASSTICLFGGHYSNKYMSGIFRTQFDFNATYTASNIGSRLVYLG